MARSRRSRRRRGGKTATQATYSVEEAIRRWDSMAASQRSTISVADSYALSAWVYSAITIITEWIVQNPFVITNHGQPVVTGDLAKLMRAPNDYPQQNTDQKFRTAYMTQLLLNGAVLRVFPDMDGIVPQSMVALARSDFMPDWHYDKVGTQVVGRWIRTGRGGAVPFIANDDIFHDALYNPYHDFEGLAPLTAAVLGINADINLSELLNRFFENDASTGMIMSSKEPLTRTQIEDAVKAWDLAHGGMSKKYSTKFIGHGLEPHQIGTGFNAEVQKTLKVLTRDEIMNGIFKIPPVIYAGETPTSGVQIGGRTSAPEKETFLVNVVMVWAIKYDQEFNKDVAPRFGVGYHGAHDFTTNPILEHRRLERAQAAVELIDRGVTLNQVIKWLKLDLQPEPHGDEYWVRGGTVPASVVMAAGDRALSTAGTNKEALDNYVRDITRLAESVQVQNETRTDPARIAAGNGKSNLSRIGELTRC